MYSLFVSLELPQSIKDSLANLCNGLPGAMWLDPDQFHLTMRYIGRVDGGQFADVRDALVSVKAEPMELVLDGVGFFPPKRRSQSLWAGVGKSEELMRLRGRIDNAIKGCNLEPEGRKFMPHVTLAHFSGGNVKPDKPAHMAEYLARHSMFRSEPFVVEQFGLFSGARSHHGPIYNLESDYGLVATP